MNIEIIYVNIFLHNIVHAQYSGSDYPKFITFFMDLNCAVNELQ